MRLLDPYEGQYEVHAASADQIATISAGYRGEDGFPVAARDGRIHLHDPSGRAPGLQAALEAAGGKSLTLALVAEPESGGVAQRFSRYSKSALEAYGGLDDITVLNQNGRVTYAAGTPEYEKVRATCKADTFIYFALAGWVNGTPRLTFPDGFGVYRLRTTSRNSARNLAATLALIAKFTGGRVAGVPLTATINMRDVAGPDGRRRSVPVWSFVMRPPAELSLGAADVRKALERGIAEVSTIQALPMPSAPTIDDLLLDVETAIDDDALDALDALANPRADATTCRRAYFAITQGTALAEKEGRAAFIRGAANETGIDTASLSEFLAMASPEQADKLLALAEATASKLKASAADAGLARQLRDSLAAAGATRTNPEPTLDEEDDPEDQPALLGTEVAGVRPAGELLAAIAAARGWPPLDHPAWDLIRERVGEDHVSLATWAEAVNAGTKREPQTFAAFRAEQGEYDPYTDPANAARAAELQVDRERESIAHAYLGEHLSRLQLVRACKLPGWVGRTLAAKVALEASPLSGEALLRYLSEQENE